MVRGAARRFLAQRATANGLAAFRRRRHPRRVHHRLRTITDVDAETILGTAQTKSTQQVRGGGLEFRLGERALFLGALIQSGVFQDHPGETTAKTVVIFIGVFVFAFLFAVNSAIHSYLVVKYADGNKVAINAGYYYMANAFGRLVGTIISGALYSYAGTPVEGFAACFWASSALVLLSALLELYIDDDAGGLSRLDKVHSRRRRGIHRCSRRQSLIDTTRLARSHSFINNASTHLGAAPRASHPRARREATS